MAAIAKPLNEVCKPLNTIQFFPTLHIWMSSCNNESIINYHISFSLLSNTLYLLIIHHRMMQYNDRKHCSITTRNNIHIYILHDFFFTYTRFIMCNLRYVKRVRLEEFLYLSWDQHFVGIDRYSDYTGYLYTGSMVSGKEYY